MSHGLTSSLSKPVRCCIGSTMGAVSDVRPARLRPAHLSHRAGQRGVALVVALVLLVVLTLVGLAAVRGTIMQQKMTSNFTDRQIAFQVGEAGMRQAQIVVQALATPIVVSALPAKIRDCSPAGGHVCLANPLTDTGLPAADIQPLSATVWSAGTLAAGQPKYVIEYMGNFKAPTPTVTQLSGCSGYAPCGLSNTADYYRITVVSGPAAGTTDRATVTLQSMFRR